MNRTKLIIYLAAITATSANASSISCPATVKAGTQLTVTAKITNEDCFEAMLVQSKVVSLIGTSGSGGLSLQGPFVKPFANGFNVSIPPAKCQSVPIVPSHPEYGSRTVVTPTTHIFRNLVVVNEVPLPMAGKMVAASAGVLDTENKITVAGVCNISVTK